MTTNQNYEEWIINWFIENTDVNSTKIKNNLNENYLGKGWIDSFKFISFITEIEDYFKLKFSNDEFQNRKFATIHGLVEILRNKTNGTE